MKAVGRQVLGFELELDRFGVGQVWSWTGLEFGVILRRDQVSLRVLIVIIIMIIMMIIMTTMMMMMIIIIIIWNSMESMEFH